MVDAAATFYKVAGGSRNRQVGLGNIARHPDYKKGKKYLIQIYVFILLFTKYFIFTNYNFFICRHFIRV